MLLPDFWFNFTEVNKYDDPISIGETFAKLVWHHCGHYLLHLPEASQLHINLPFGTVSATQNDAGSVSLLLSNDFRECENEDNYKTHLNNVFTGEKLKIAIFCYSSHYFSSIFFLLPTSLKISFSLLLSQKKKKEKEKKAY